MPPSSRLCLADADAQVQQIDVILPLEKADEVQTEMTVAAAEREFIDFSNGPVLTAIACLIFVIVLAANLYVIVMLGLGRT